MGIIIGTIHFSNESIFNGKIIKDMTDDEKQAVLDHFAAKGSKCIVEGFNEE